VLTGKKLTGLAWKTKKQGLLFKKNHAAWFESQVIENHNPGSHSLFIGEVINSGVNEHDTTLCTLEYDGMYVGKE